MDERDFARFSITMRFGRIFHIAQGPSAQSGMPLAFFLWNIPKLACVKSVQIFGQAGGWVATVGISSHSHYAVNVANRSFCLNIVYSSSTYNNRINRVIGASHWALVLGRKIYHLWITRRDIFQEGSECQSTVGVRISYRVTSPLTSLGLWPVLVNTVNSLRPRRNRRHFADDFFKCIFLNENEWISIKISLKFVPKGPINNISALVQIMAWRRPGDKPLSEPMLVSLPTHICVARPQWVK